MVDATTGIWRERKGERERERERERKREPGSTSLFTNHFPSVIVQVTSTSFNYVRLCKLCTKKPRTKIEQCQARQIIAQSSRSITQCRKRPELHVAEHMVISLLIGCLGSSHF